MFRGSRLVAQATAALVVASAFGVLVAGCGGSDDTVVRFKGRSHGSIDRSTLDHWMQAAAGADIQHNLDAEGPTGLASDPADYPRCIAAAKLVGPRSFFNQLRFGHAEAIQKCHELHQAIEVQALSFLIRAHWTMVEAAERRITVSAAEVRSALGRGRTSLYPTEAMLRSYLNERHWSLSDLLFQLKLDLLGERLRTNPSAGAASEAATHSSLAGIRALVALDAQRLQAFARRTSCAPGYVVPGCSGYRGTATSASPPDALIQQLTGRRTGEPAGPR